MTALSARLRELAGRATKAPWEVRHHPSDKTECFIEAPHPTRSYAREIMGDDDEDRPSNAELLVALRNALPELLAALELAEAVDAVATHRETHADYEDDESRDRVQSALAAFRSAKEPA